MVQQHFLSCQNAIDFSANRRRPGPISWYYFFLKIIDVNYTSSIPKNWLNHVVLMAAWTRSVVVKSCFVHGYETSQKFVRIAIEWRAKYFFEVITRLESNVSKRGIHPNDSFLIYKWWLKMETAETYELPMTPTISRAFNLQSAKPYCGFFQIVQE